MRNMFTFLIIVDSNFRKQKIATTLMQKLKDISSEIGIDYIVSAVHKDNVSSNIIHQKL